MIDRLFAFFTSPLGVVLLAVFAIVPVVFGFLVWLGRRARVLKEPVIKAEILPPPPPPPPPAPKRPFINPQSGRPVLGREKEVETLRTLLTGPATGVALTSPPGAVLSGHGGFGKSTLAREYVRVHGGEYHGGAWFKASARREAVDQLCDASADLGLPAPETKGEPQAKAVVAAIAREVAEGRQWLLVFDNVEDRKDLDGLLPPDAHILVTTRQGAGWAGWKPFAVKTLPCDKPDDPGPTLLMEAAGRKDKPEAARALAEALGGLPLALVLMGGFLKAEGIGFAAGAAHLKEAMAREPANEGYPTSLLGAVRLSYGKLSDDSKIVAQLCSFWAPEGLGPKLITDAPGGWLWDEWREDLIPDPVQSLAQDPARIRAAIAELSARSLLIGTGEARAMHRMTALALREIGETALAPAAVALLAAVYPGGERSPGHSPQWPLCARLTPHVRAFLASGAAPEVEAWDYLLNQAGLYLSVIADFRGALRMAEESLRIKMSRLNEGDRDLAVGYSSFGTALRRMERWEEAEVALRRAVDLDEAHRPNSADLAHSLDLLGGFFVHTARAGNQRRLDEAAKLRQRALALNLRLFGKRSDPTAQSLNNLGVVRGDQGRRRASARLFRASYAIRQEVLPVGDARLGYSALNGGASWLQAGNSARAEPLLRKALAIWEAAFADQRQHPDRRDAAEWLISCLLVRARAGINRGAREAEAKRLCAEYGFDFAEMERRSRQFPDSPPEE